MSDNVDVVDLVSNLLDSGKYKEVLSVHNEEKYASSFKDNCWDMISVAVSKIQDETIVIKPSLYSTVEELLTIIAEKATPEEALLEFIEQVEVAKNDAQFGIVLTPLQQLLKKLSAKRGRSLEWCLNSISNYIENIPTPEFQLEGRERILAECDPNIRRIIRVYSMVPPFYQPFIEELKAPESHVRTKQIITAFLISLLGKPLIYLDLDIDNNEQSEARLSCNTILRDICSLEKNILKFLDYVEICNKENQKSKTKSSESKEEISPYDHREKLNMLTLSGLYYVVLSSQFDLPDGALPQVYATEYIVHTGMLCVIYLLSCPEYGPQAKALTLCEALVKQLQTNAAASHTLLSAAVHFNLCKALVNIAIYATYEGLRKHAVTAICHHVNCFEYSGRCMLIKYIISSSNHSGMIGYAITLLKNSVNDALNEPELPACFMHLQLLGLIKKVCHLPHGAESDLMELSDQIISALNFLRFLVLRDTANITGIRECYSYIESEYLTNLRTALNMSKAHYEVKLKEIEQGIKIPEGVNVSINVGGHLLDGIPNENKKEIIQSALNCFHLMEGLVARLSEFIRNGRKVILPLATVPLQNAQRQIRCYSQTVEKEMKAPTTVSTEHEENQYEESIKNRILEKALEFVTKNGWSVESLSAGAEAAGYPGVAHGLFPNGGGDLIHYLNVKCNDSLVEEMKNWSKEQIKESKVPAKFLENAILTRLLMIEPYKSTWPKAMAIQAFPNNVPNSLATLLSLVDDICYHSGDRSVDFNWYIRRVGLAGIYKASELFYLTDSSPGNTATKSFIASRIRDAELLQSALSLSPVAATPQTLSAAFVTAKNVLGMNPLK